MNAAGSAQSCGRAEQQVARREQAAHRAQARGHVVVREAGLVGVKDIMRRVRRQPAEHLGQRQREIRRRRLPGRQMMQQQHGAMLLRRSCKCREAIVEQPKPREEARQERPEQAQSGRGHDPGVFIRDGSRWRCSRDRGCGLRRASGASRSVRSVSRDRPARRNGRSKAASAADVSRPDGIVAIAHAARSSAGRRSAKGASRASNAARSLDESSWASAAGGASMARVAGGDGCRSAKVRIAAATPSGSGPDPIAARRSASNSESVMSSEVASSVNTVSIRAGPAPVNAARSSARHAINRRRPGARTPSAGVSSSRANRLSGRSPRPGARAANTVPSDASDNSGISRRSAVSSLISPRKVLPKSRGRGARRLAHRLVDQALAPAVAPPWHAPGSRELVDQQQRIGRRIRPGRCAAGRWAAWLRAVTRPARANAAGSAASMRTGSWSASARRSRAPRSSSSRSIRRVSSGAAAVSNSCSSNCVTRLPIRSETNG